MKLNWKQKDLKVKETQGLINQKLKKKKTRCRDIWMQSRHQHRIRSRRNISLQGESCSDNIRMSRQQLYREEVATTPGCHDITCMDQKVATSISCCDVSDYEKRSRQDQAVATPTSLKNLSQPHIGSYDKDCDKNRGRDEDMISRQHQQTGPVY